MGSGQLYVAWESPEVGDFKLCAFIHNGALKVVCKIFFLLFFCSSLAVVFLSPSDLQHGNAASVFKGGRIQKQSE